MDRISVFDLVILLALLAMFVVGYAQGVIRRLFGIAAILFSLIVAAQLRAPLGDYLAQQWGGIAPAYSHMVAFGAVFAAAAITLSIGIQITYRPAPLFQKFPVLDEIVGGLLGVLEGFLILIVVILILDPYYNQATVQATVGRGEFTLLRDLHARLNESIIVEFLRTTVIPPILAVIGILFPQEIRDAF